METILNKRFAAIAFVFLTPALLLIAFLGCKEDSPGRLILNFHATVDGEPLAFDQVRYQNPGGAGKFKIRAFQFYLSNIKLVGASGEYSEPESYHLARFDNEDQVYSIVLDGVPRLAYERVEFSIGVDEVANNSIAPLGDLDANSRMAWSWDVGYKFVIFEGVLELDDEQIPLVYHIGFDENYKSIAVNLDERLFGQHEESLDFEVDVMKSFTGTTLVDMALLPSVKFDKTDARLIADNYATMVTLRAPGHGESKVIASARE